VLPELSLFGVKVGHVTLKSRLLCMYRTVAVVVASIVVSELDIGSGIEGPELAARPRPDACWDPTAMLSSSLLLLGSPAFCCNDAVATEPGSLCCIRSMSSLPFRRSVVPLSQ